MLGGEWKRTNLILKRAFLTYLGDSEPDQNTSRYDSLPSSENNEQINSHDTSANGVR